MGTYRLRLTVLSETDVDEQLAFDPGLDAYFVGVAIGGTPATPRTNGTVAYISFGECMYLDGSGTPISLFALPLGFRLPGSAITLRNWVGGPHGTIIGQLMQRVGIAPITDFARCISQDGAYNNTQTLFGSGSGSTNNISSLLFNPTELIDLFVTLTLNIIVSDPVRFTTWIFKQLELVGSYDLITWSWQIANGIDIGDNVKAFGAEAPINVSSGGGATGDLSNIYSTATPSKTGPDLKGTFGAGSGGGVESISFTWYDGVDNQTLTIPNADFDDWTVIFISFLLPDTLPLDTIVNVTAKLSPAPAIPISGGGTGTQFTGSVLLGKIKILSVAASGIYRIVPDKRNDTIYINAPTNDDTADVAIPYPHGKTGFIGG